MRAAAAAHAAQRLEHAVELTQLIHEVRLLRATILRLLLAAETAEQESEGREGMGDRVTELARLNAALDFVITDAVERFVAERDRRLLQASQREAALARESDQRKSEFLAVLSHELRNPLAPIRNGLFILERAEPGSEQAAQARTIIQRQTQHLTRLVDDLLDVTRISRGKIELHQERFDLRDVVRGTCDDHRPEFEQRGIALRLEMTTGPVWIDGDPTRIAQVLSILCDIGLPDIDGYEVARALRTDGEVPVTRLVALSGYAQPEDKLRAKDAGFDAHLSNRHLSRS